MTAVLVAVAAPSHASLVTIHAQGEGVVRPTDLECGRLDSPPICFKDFLVKVDLQYIDPDRAASNILGLDAIQSISIRVFAPQGGASIRAFDFDYPSSQHGVGARYSAEIHDSEDALALAFSGFDGFGRWGLGLDGGVHIDNLHGEGFSGPAGALQWKVLPEPGAASLCAIAVLGLVAQRRMCAARSVRAIA